MKKLIMFAAIGLLCILSSFTASAHEYREIQAYSRVSDSTLKKAFDKEADDVDHIVLDGINFYYVDAEDEITTLDIDYGTQFVIIIRNGEQLRNICPECGYNTMRLRTWEENTRIRRCSCPLVGAMYRDDAARMDMFYGDYCSICGQLNTYNDGHYYMVHCENGLVGDPEWYEVIPGATLDDGYNPHQCMSFSF